MYSTLLLLTRKHRFECKNKKEKTKTKKNRSRKLKERCENKEIRGTHRDRAALAILRLGLAHLIMFTESNLCSWPPKTTQERSS